MRRFWQKVGAILEDLYAALWRNTAGRPWTYVMREWFQKHPKTASWVLPVILAGFIAASWEISLLTFKLRLFLTILQAFAWLLTGHLFWDTAGAYIPKPRRRKEN